MSPSVRPATLEDIPHMVELLLADAAQRCAHDPTFWKMAEDAQREIKAALRVAFQSEGQQVQQFWHVSVEG